MVLTEIAVISLFIFQANNISIVLGTYKVNNI